MSLFQSSTLIIPEAPAVPRHIAVIMDGNGRWAKQRLMPRVAGHQRGVEALREVVKACRDMGVEYLTVFAFSSENWRRPADEVSFLMKLFLKMLEREVAKLHQNDIRLKIIGDRSRFDAKLGQAMQDAERLTAGNSALTLTIAANYGGRWDVMQAVKAMLKEQPQLVQSFTEEDLQPFFSMSDAPEPDLFIRTGGEQRISNFLLWQLAYTELYFTDTLWPAFDRIELNKAIASYQKRERRFGRTSEQLQRNAGQRDQNA
ncbi:MAG: Isoprenyl transferase [Candidatus Gallionella acididurans]|uniref:Isoprenyl transferase n=1 Tax=Candidatus Gallionella acididurans TaxID=1796491 RepID=A0A139BTC9_9PROT|nr:MAG: Isoprenyl transferase [Candidatus Gallionella acididurans]